MMALAVIVTHVALLIIGIAQDSITGSRGPLNLEVVAATAVIVVVGMFLWYLRWHLVQAKEALATQASTNASANHEQALTFEKSLERILEHDKSNHEQTMIALREITQHQAEVAIQLQQITTTRRIG